MTGPQIIDVRNLMAQTITKELGHPCGHYSQGKGVYFRSGYQSPKDHDFYVDFPCGANGTIKARLFAKDNGTHVCVYGPDFENMRKKIRAREREVEKLGVDRFEVYNSEPKTSTKAVWCRFHHRGNKNWYANRQQVIVTIKDFLKWLTSVVA